MKSIKEIIEELNSLKIIQKSMDFTEDLDQDILDKYFTNCVKELLDVDKHRWYETSTEVLKMNDGFIGIRSVTNCYSENSSIKDMFWTLNFFEMEEISSITYKKLK